MMMSLVSIVIVGVIAYVWVTRGFFSALINMVCVLAAGAIAFAAWEPLAYWLLDSAPDRGLWAFVSGVAWSAGLLVPFAVSLALLRVGVDKLLPGNVIINDVANYVGGGFCGLVSGVVTAGIVVIGLGFLRVPTEFMGHRPLYYEAGNLQRQSGLWVPVDTLTAKLYEKLSTSTLRTPEPLARWYPDLELAGPSLRVSFGEGKARNTMRPTDFTVLDRYTVGDGVKTDANSLLADAWNPAAQRVTDIEGEIPQPGSHIEGFVVKFASGSREKTGQIMVGSGQIRLVAESSTDPTDTRTFHPVAVVAQAEAADPSFARFRYDANEVFIASVGGQSESTMAFEFVVPAGFRPIALYVKNVRHEVTGEAGTKFPVAATRDAVIQSGALTSGGAALSGPLDTTGATGVETNPRQGTGATGLSVTNSIGFVIQKGTEQALEVQEGRVIDGEQIFTREQLVNRGLDRNLRIDRFAITNDTVVVQVDVSLGQPASLLGASAATAETGVPPVIVDNLGQRYEAIGYIYQDNTQVKIRFTPGRPLRGTSEAPSLSRSRPDQKLTLLFRASLGVQVTSFAIGNKVITQYDPPVDLKTPQK